MHVPNVQPPLPTDWEVHPTHPTQFVPYKVAQYWDHGVRQQLEEKTAKLLAQRKQQQLKTGSATGLAAGEVPRDLRESAKRSTTIQGWVRALEQPVRQYLCVQQQAERLKEDGPESDSAADDMDSEDEEIVFVGRKGGMRERPGRGASWKLAHREVEQQKVDSGMVFDSFGDDESAAFKFVVHKETRFQIHADLLTRRWLTHSISDYYGLQSRSVSLANPSRRVVYVGLNQAKRGTNPPRLLPRPLWEICC